MTLFDYICLVFALCAGLAAIFFILYYRNKTKTTLENASEMIDRAIAGGFTESVFDESLLSSVETKLSQYLSSCSASSNKLAEEKDKIKELIADISHQTKTPVSNILLYTQLLGEQNLSPESTQYVSALSEQAGKLSFLIESLVKVSRLEAGIIMQNPRISELQPLLRAVEAQIAPNARGKNITVTVTETDEKAFFDPKWTAEAVYNIADNAVKYTPFGGTVEISVAAFELFCRIDVKDSGIGVSEDEQSKIFSRFYRSPRVGELDGVGIGLYLSREIISGEGGYIKVTSQQDKGSVFSVYLPRES